MVSPLLQPLAEHFARTSANPAGKRLSMGLYAGKMPSMAHDQLGRREEAGIACSCHSINTDCTEIKCGVLIRRLPLDLCRGAYLVPSNSIDVAGTQDIRQCSGCRRVLLAVATGFPPSFDVAGRFAGTNDAGPSSTADVQATSASQSHTNEQAAPEPKPRSHSINTARCF